MFIGSQHVETPFVEIGAIATVLYFAWFIIITPIVGIIENTLNTTLTKVKSQI